MPEELHEPLGPQGAGRVQCFGGSSDIAHALNPGRIFSSRSSIWSGVSDSFGWIGNASFTLRRKFRRSIANTAKTRSENRF